MALVLVLFLFIGIAAINYDPFKTITDKIVGSSVEIEQFESCSDYDDLPVTLSDVFISKDAHNRFVIHGRIDMKETLDRPLKLVIEMHRCSSKDDPGTCEYYFTFKKDRICDMLEHEASWGYFINGTDLPQSCPYTKGSYKLNGTTVDIRDLKWLPLYDSYWRISSRTFMKNKLMFCVKGYLIVKKQRT